MKTSSYMGTVVAAGAVTLGALGPAEVVAADATKPTYNSKPTYSSARPQPGTARPQRSGPNDNDYHADYHADYSATQNGRPAPPKTTTEDQADPRQNARKFQDGVRAVRSPYDWRR